MDNKKVCPLKFGGQNSFAQDCYCEEKNCAWWCEWTKSCAMAAIPAEISDRAYDVMQTIGG